ncbi:MAG: ATP synthase F0 subunit B [Ruminococcaceae bacterium]|jgi:F-type H+-transporting ATPase subunit b|nr:ATP synthase F0 subunit B [Oscillospiraceae bacterium]
MPLNIDWQQILLHLLNFVILAGGLYFILYKPVKEFMAKREQHYKEIDDYAMKNRVEAEELRKAAQEKLDAAEEEIAAMHVKASDEIEAEKQRQLGEARAEARRILETAGKTAELRSKKALADSNDDIRALAMDAVRKMLLSDGNALDHFLDAAESESRNG